MAFRRGKKKSEAVLKKTKLKQLKEKRDTLKMALRCARSTADHPASVMHSIEQDEASIKMLQERIARNREALESCHVKREQLTDELSKLNSEIKLEQNSVKVRALKNLAMSMKQVEHMKDLGYNEEQIKRIKEKMLASN